MSLKPKCQRLTEPKYREREEDTADIGAIASAFDADALAATTLNTFRSDAANDVLAVKLKEAGVAR